MQTDLDKLAEAQAIAEKLPYTKLAALAKCCLLLLIPRDAHGYESLSLGELDAITNEDPELD